MPCVRERALRAPVIDGTMRAPSLRVMQNDEWPKREPKSLPGKATQRGGPTPRVSKRFPKVDSVAQTAPFQEVVLSSYSRRDRSE